VSESSEPGPAPTFRDVPPSGYPSGGMPDPGYTPYQSYGYPYPMMPGMAPQLPKGMAITGMVLGIVGLVTSLFYIGGVVGLVGLVFSIIALRAVRQGRSAGKGMAIAGLVTSILAIILNVIEIVLIVWVVHTFTNCSQYDPGKHPDTGSQSQFDQCMRQGIFGN